MIILFWLVVGLLVRQNKAGKKHVSYRFIKILFASFFNSFIIAVFSKFSYVTHVLIFFFYYVIAQVLFEMKLFRKHCLNVNAHK